MNLPLDGVSANQSGYSGGGGSSVGFTFDPYASASTRVTYFYEDIPEPGTLALLGFGLIASGIFLKRRRDA